MPDDKPESEMSKVGGRAKSASKGLSGLANSQTPTPQLASFKRGGKVKRTGPAKLEKGERVLTKKQSRKYSKKRDKGK